MSKKAEKPNLDLLTQVEALRKQHIPLPTINYEVGQLVRLGGLKNPRITASFDQGTILCVVSADALFTNHVVPWTAIAPIPDPDVPVFSHKDDVQLSFYSTPLGSILNSYYSAGIDMNPPYQRELVWDENDKMALIDSIFNNIDIGKFTLVHRGFSVEVMYEIVDGKQRLSALTEFFEGRFAYRGLVFQQMSNRDRHQFLDYLVSWAVSEHLSSEQKMKLFLKLNTTGRPQDLAHLQKVREMLAQEQK